MEDVDWGKFESSLNAPKFTDIDNQPMDLIEPRMLHELFLLIIDIYFPFRYLEYYLSPNLLTLFQPM